jgi:uncharacterized iron-regulated membrane protein
MTYRFFRRLFYETHLWLGIASGLILFAVCLSGTILTFQTEFRQIAEPARYYVDVPDGKNILSADELIAKVESAKAAMKVVSITIPEQPHRTVVMNLASPDQSGEQGGRMEQRERGARPEGRVTPSEGNQRPQGGRGNRSRNVVYVNPYTGDIVGEGANVVDPFFMSMMRLHRFLWLPTEIGRPIVGTATIIFILLFLSGLVLWMPKMRNSLAKWRAWKSGLHIRFKKGGWALLYDLHNAVGFYVLIPSLILALTGLCWSFAWYRDAASYVLGDQIFKQRMQLPEKIEPMGQPEKPLSIAEMIARKNDLVPGPGEISVSIPADNETAMVIRKGRTGFFDLNMMDRSQWDPYRGTVILVDHHGKMVEVERFADKPLGAKIAVSIRGLHFGDITGMSSKIFFFIVCFLATSLPVTGTIWWMKKLRTKYKRRKGNKKTV